MPDLNESLQEHDLSHLHIVAGLWGLELDAPDVRLARERLVPALLDGALVREMVNSLEGVAQSALAELAGRGGRMPWGQFTRRFGKLREMGAARRDREQPYLNPDSPVEVLWYRALLARAFFDTPSGPEEFAYIPSDLLLLLPQMGRQPAPPLGRPATQAEAAHVLMADDRILDHACTLLAGLRMGLPEAAFSAAGEVPPVSPANLHSLLACSGLLNESGQPLPEPTRLFLESPRAQALALLVHAWLECSQFNELRQLPGLSAEGNWMNDPLQARQAVLGFLDCLPSATWWSLPAFLAAVKREQPDFQRPAGDYDSWHIRRIPEGSYVKGFNDWDDVDGALLRYLISGPLHWLGILDLACPATGAPVAAFRYSAWADALLQGQPPAGLPAEEEALYVRSDARLRLPRLAPRHVRYQLARFCEWDEAKPEEYHYRLTPASLGRARQQGLTTAHLLGLLRRHATLVPPSLVKALERWEQHGNEVRVEPLMVLRVSSPEVLQSLRKTRAARFLGDVLGANAIAIKPGGWQKVLAALAEMGYLGDARIEAPPGAQTE